MLALVCLPPRTAAREWFQSAQVQEATAHWAVFEPLGLATEPFQVLGLLLLVQEPVQAHSGLVREQELQPQGSANPLRVVTPRVLEFLLGA